MRQVRSRYRQSRFFAKGWQHKSVWMSDFLFHFEPLQKFDTDNSFTLRAHYVNTMVPQYELNMKTSLF